MPFMSWIVKLTYLIVPGEDNDVEDEYEMKYIGDGDRLSVGDGYSAGLQ